MKKCGLATLLHPQNRVVLKIHVSERDGALRIASVWVLTQDLTQKYGEV